MSALRPLWRALVALTATALMLGVVTQGQPVPNPANISPGNLLAEFDRIEFPGEQACPASIEHVSASVADNGVVTVRHADIRMEGECLSNGTFTIVPAGLVTTLPEVQQVLGNNPDAAAGLGRLLEMVSGQLLVGLERTRRRCVGGTFPPNTLFFFSRVGVDIPPFVTPLIGNIAKGDTIMSILSFEGTPFGCTFVSRASRVASSGSGGAAAGGGGASAGSGGGDGDGPACFPATARVSLADGRSKPVSELELGETVAVGPDVHSEVFLFTHRQADSLHDFIRLTTPLGALVASPGHYVYLNGKLAPALAARIGDRLTRADGTSAQIADVERVRARGLYNPQTLHGDIVVDGFRVSTYTTAVRPPLADALLAPLRGLHRLGISLRALSACFDGGLPAPLARWFIKG